MNIIFFFTGLVVVLSSLSVRLTKKFKIPVLAIYLIFGMVVGSFSIDFGFFGSFANTQFLSIIALCYILFSAGLEMEFKHVKTIVYEGLSLATVGIIITTVIVGAFMKFLLPDFSWIECLIFGTVVSSTDSAAVIAALDFRKVDISNKIKNLLKFESGSNDPMAFTLLLFFLATLAGNAHHISRAVLDIVIELGVGFAWGFFFAKLGFFILHRLSAKIYEYDHILLLGLVVFTFAVSNLAFGNGFLSVYIFGLFLAREEFQYKHSTARFFNTISGVLQIFMFIGLGILVDIKELYNLAIPGLILAFMAIFIARPVAVFLSLAPFGRKYSIKEQIFISWGGLKGAVPIIFATYPVVAQTPHGIAIFNLVFFCVIISIILQGLTLDNLANILKIPKDSDDAIALQETVHLGTMENIEQQLVEIKVMQQNFLLNKKVKDVLLPQGSLIITIERNHSYFSPTGDTELLGGDLLFIMTADKIEFQKYLKNHYNNLSES